MKSIVNALSLAVSLCLISGQVMAETGLQAFKFKIPASVTSQPPQYSFKQIYQASKSGELKSRTRLGGMDAGGGKILLCPSPTGVKAKVLDIYEGEAAGKEIDLGNGKTLDEKIKYVLGRLAHVAPYRARAYAQAAQNLLNNESAFYSKAVMPVTDDIGVAVIPEGCEPVQVIVQRNDEDADIPGFSKYLFDRDVFAQLDLDSQAALVLHEVIYREARARGETNSVRARFLNYLILSTSMETMTLEKFNLILSKMKSECLEIAGVSGRYGCKGLPDVYVEQSISWRGVRLKGPLSFASNFDDDFMGVHTSAPVIDLTETAKFFVPKTPFSIKAIKTKEVMDFHSMGQSFESSDSSHFEAVSSRAKVSGKDCLVIIGRNTFGHPLTLFCFTETSITTSKGTRKESPINAGSGFYIFLLDSGEVETFDR
jgi:hypothetical protein